MVITDKTETVTRDISTCIEDQESDLIKKTDQSPCETFL